GPRDLAGRRLDTVGDPVLQRDQQCPVHGGDVQPVYRVGGGQRLLDLAAPEVVGARDQIGADVGVLGQVPAGVGVHGQQGAVAVQVLRGAVGEDRLRHAAELALPGKQIGVRERGEVAEAVGLGDRRLCVAVVELSGGGAGEVAEHAIKYGQTGFVDIQPVEKE